MLETLKARKEALEARGESGFTLMEMLIVIAIIAILVAIAIPIFTSQLENSREAADAANIRSTYAEVTTAAITSPAKDTTATVTLTQSQNGWQNTGITEIAGVNVDRTNAYTASTTGEGNLGASNGASVEIKYTASTNKVTIGGIEAEGPTVTTAS